MLYAMLFGCFYYPTDKNPFVSSEILHEEFREIHGDPVYDVYDDESQIQVEDIVNDNHGQENVVEIGLHVVEDVDPIIHVYDEAYMLGDVYGEEDAKTIDYIFGDKAFENCKRSATVWNIITQTVLKRALCVLRVTYYFFGKSQLLSSFKRDNRHKIFMKIFKLAMKFDVRDRKWSIFYRGCIKG